MTAEIVDALRIEEEEEDEREEGERGEEEEEEGASERKRPASEAVDK